MLSRHWPRPAGEQAGADAAAFVAPSEQALVARSIAGALALVGDLAVGVAGDPDAPARPDGAFDLFGIGRARSGMRWPEPGEAVWPGEPPALWVVDDASDSHALAIAGALPQRSADGPAPVLGIVQAGSTSSPLPELAEHPAAAQPVAAQPVAAQVFNGLVAATQVGASTGWQHGSGGDMPGGMPGDVPGGMPGDTEARVDDVGLFLPTNPLAAQRPFLGFGPDSYVLVLCGDNDGANARWLAAGLARRHMITVYAGFATEWQGRSPLGTLPVGTRTDLWRLMARASVTVDLSPGEVVARECVESLLYGTPIVVPAGSTAAGHAARGGGLWYSSLPELFGCIEALDDPDTRLALSEQGRSYATSRYGDAGSFVERVARAVGASPSGS
ncbi:MAG: hypothetical protein ACYCUF_08945 [Acidimicrobiales bacterium]|nr:hypothetical protein [Actinomycetota bacterium]MDA8185794.1 hypothetical protein [Actinomycetota bacterium]